MTTDRSPTAIPARLRDRDHWIVTHGKRPVCPEAGWPDRDRQLSYQRAKDMADEQDSLAYCFHQDDPFLGFDFDDVRPEGNLTDEVESWVADLDSYTEISQSGTGLHVIVEGEYLCDRRYRGDLETEGHVEVFNDAQYFVLTGDTLAGKSTITAQPDLVREFQSTYLDRNESEPDRTPATDQVAESDADVTPAQVRKTIEAYVNHGDTRREVVDLWQGHDGYHGGDRSAADHAFVGDLCFWCRRDPDLIDDCFRSSDRMREKWDNIHTADNRTYGQLTIDNALKDNKEIFRGRYVNSTSND